MEYLLLGIVMLQWFVIYKLYRKTEPITEEKQERLRKEAIEKDWQKLFNYNETIATRGYKR